MSKKRKHKETERVRAEIIEAINQNKLRTLRGVMAQGFTNHEIYRKCNCHEDNEIQDLLEKYQTAYTKDLKTTKATYIQGLVTKALELCKTNTILFRIDFLCNHLRISLRNFYDYGLHHEPEIREALDFNAVQIKQKKYSQLINNEDLGSNIATLKLLGTETERQKISTAYQEIKQETKHSGNIKVKDVSKMSAKELDEELAKLK